MKFTKVFISEDIDSNNLGMVTAVRKLGVADVDHSQSCDDTFIKIKNAVLKGIIVFSQYDEQATIKPLIEEVNIDGYVCKGLNGLKELEKAIVNVAMNKKYTCPVATASLRQQNVLQLNDFQQQLLKLLAEGNKQTQISEIFIAENIEPNSVRSIETNISKLKDAFNATNTTQLVYMASNFGLI